MQWINGLKGSLLMAFLGVALSAQAVVQLAANAVKFSAPGDLVALGAAPFLFLAVNP